MRARVLGRGHGRVLAVARARARDERGASGPLQMALVTTVLVLSVGTIIQLVLMLNASDVAQQAAQEGAAAARRFDGTQADGVRYAHQFLDQSGSSTLLAADVTATRSPQRVTVRVSGEVETIVPFVHFHVDQQAAGPVEHYVAPVNNR